MIMQRKGMCEVGTGNASKPIIFIYITVDTFSRSDAIKRTLYFGA